LEPRSNLEAVLRSKEFALTVELAASASAHPEPTARRAKELAPYGDAFNVTDNQLATVKMSSLGLASICIQAGVEPVMQLTTRDRNRIALQSDILAAHALGVRNVLCLGGDPAKLGNEKEAVEVNDISSIDQIRAYRGMRDEGRLLGGGEISSRPDLLIGGTSTPFGGSFEVAVDLLEKKTEAGADFIQTQAVYDLDGVEEFMEMVREAGIPERVSILFGVIPIRSVAMARYLAEKVPGIQIPREVMERIEEASDAKAEGVDLAVETIQALKACRGVAGAHIMPVGSEGSVAEITERAGLLPRPGK
jgi:methylenetetrahydrofolate reductase (NADPH)